MTDRVNPGWRRHGLLIAFAIPAAATALFPEIDLWIAALFYEPGAGFPADHGDSYHQAIRGLVRLVSWAGGGAVLLALLWRVLLGRRLGGIERQAVLAVLFAMLLGPLLLTNGILKEHWGRARPAQIAEFGGERRFTPAWQPANECPHNCAFVSGDASAGFIFVVFGLVARRPVWRAAGLGCGAGLGALFGYTRIVQGGHFTSDVLFAAVFMYLVAWLCVWLFVRRDLFAPLLLLLPRPPPRRVQ